MGTRLLSDLGIGRSRGATPHNPRVWDAEADALVEVRALLKVGLAVNVAF